MESNHLAYGNEPSRCPAPTAIRRDAFRPAKEGSVGVEPTTIRLTAGRSEPLSFDPRMPVRRHTGSGRRPRLRTPSSNVPRENVLRAREVGNDRRRRRVETDHVEHSGVVRISNAEYRRRHSDHDQLGRNSPCVSVVPQSLGRMHDSGPSLVVGVDDKRVYIDAVLPRRVASSPSLAAIASEKMAGSFLGTRPESEAATIRSIVSSPSATMHRATTFALSMVSWRSPFSLPRTRKRSRPQVKPPAGFSICRACGAVFAELQHDASFRPTAVDGNGGSISPGGDGPGPPPGGGFDSSSATLSRCCAPARSRGLR